MIVVVTKQSSKVCTAPLIHSGFILLPVTHMSGLLALLSFSEAGSRSAQAGAMSAALIWFDREGVMSRGRFGDLPQIRIRRY